MPELPATFTVGGLSPETRLEAQVRRWMIGLGFQEVMTNILSSRSDLAEKMGAEPPMVELENPLSLQYAVLRPWLLPSLLRVEAASGHAFYPHKMFEVGEVATVFEEAGPSTRTTTTNRALAQDSAPRSLSVGLHGVRRSRTDLRLAALLASPSAAFSELHSSLELVMLEAGAAYRLEPAADPAVLASFLEGRVGVIRIGDQAAGWIGEIHPAVLERWKITMPCVAWELDLTRLRPTAPTSRRPAGPPSRG